MPNVLSKTSKQLPQKFNFHAFNFQTQIFPNGFYTCFGKRGSGKTTFMMHASQHMPFSNTAQHIVIGGSEKIRALWATIVHPIFIHEPSIAFLKLLIEEAQRRIKYCEENRYEFPKEWEIIVWLDDCGVYSEFMHCQEMRWLCSNGRNSGFTVFLLVQKLTQAHKECREGNDGVFALFTLYQENVKMIWKENASGIKFPLFQSIYAGGTRRRGVLCLDAHCEDPVPEEIIYHSHCDLLHKDGYKGKLKMLSSDLHLKWAEEHYKSNNENNFVAENIDDNNKLECENNNANAQKEKKNTLKDGNHKNENDDEDEEDVEEESDEETKSQKGRFCDTPYENDGVYYQFQQIIFFYLLYTFEGAFFLFGAKKNHVEKKKYYKKIRKKVLRLKKKMQDLGYYQNQSFYPSPMMDAGDRTLTQPFVTSNTNMTPNSQIPQIPNSQLQQIDAIPLQTTLPTPTPTLNEQTSAVSSSSTKLSSGIIAFIVIVSILLVGLIVGVVILFLTKRNKNDNPPDTGAQGPKGAQGLIGAPGTAGPTGSPGARGSQGFQGPVATTNVLGIPFVFQCSTQNVTGANMVFNSFPGSTSASYTGSYQRVGNVVTVTCSNINCVITSSLPTPTYAFRVEMPISVFAVLSFAGVGNANRASGTTSFVQLEELIGTSSTTLTLRYGTPAEPIGGFRPLYETSFTIVYQTLVP